MTYTIALRVPMKVDGFKYQHTRTYDVTDTVYKAFKAVAEAYFDKERASEYMQEEGSTSLLCQYLNLRHFSVALATLNQLIALGGK